MKRITLPRRVKRRVVHKRLYDPNLLKFALCGAPNGGYRSTEQWNRVSCGKCLTQRRDRAEVVAGFSGEGRTPA